MSVPIPPPEGSWHMLGECKVLVTRDPPDALWHISISHSSRYPTWDEIHAARYKFTPDEVTMAMILPPKREYVNIHKNRFHLHQIFDTVLLILIPGALLSLL